jgi:CubicO group peptidase (beta-lactamase class C family)
VTRLALPLAIVLELVLATTLAAHANDEPFFDPGRSPQGFLPRKSAASARLQPALVQAMVRDALTSRSDALILLKDGHVIVERTFAAPGEIPDPGPIPVMSVTKSIVAIAVANLLCDKKIASLDAPVSTWIPHYRGGRRDRVTLRHILTHTSGIDHRPAAGFLSKQPDRVKFVLESPVVEEPGQRFSYNNEATQLLAAIIKEAAGEDVEAYLRRILFVPLGITDWRWPRDRSGWHDTFGGLALHPRALARIGLLLLRDGRWQGRQLIPVAAVRLLTTPSAPPASSVGLLWWMSYDRRDHVLSAAGLSTLSVKLSTSAQAKLRQLVEKPFESPAAFLVEAGALLDSADRLPVARLFADPQRSPLQIRTGKAVGYNANGWLGQYLMVLPEERLVAVRLRRWRTQPGWDDQRYGFGGLFTRLRNLAAVP